VFDIQVQGIIENGERYEGFDLNETGCHKVELNRSEIYGVAFRISEAIGVVKTIRFEI